jgi:glycosyltransferase involved in cell wall biosynthesis
MAERIKVLLLGESPVKPTSVAGIIRLVFGELIANHPGDFDIRQIALFHSFAITEPKWPVQATETARRANGAQEFVPEDLFGQRTFRRLFSQFRPNIVFAVGNPHHLIRSGLEKTSPECRLVLYLKIDDLPLLTSVEPLLSRADLVVTMSRFSMDALKSQFPRLMNLAYIYPPADINAFAPLQAEEKRDLREDIFPPWIDQNAFVLGWVGKPRWRKQMWALYEVIRYVRTGNYINCCDCDRITLLPEGTVSTHVPPSSSRCPTDLDFPKCARCLSRNVRPAQALLDVILWLHTPHDEAGSDWPTRLLEEEYQVEPNRDIFYTEGLERDAAVRPEDMPSLYQAWDALLDLSGSEGLALPLWEAMSASLPLICTNYSSPAEYLNGASAGIPVEGDLQPEARSGFFRFVPDVASAVEAVHRIYYDRGLGQTLGKNGRAFVAKYTTKTQVETWCRLLRQIASGSEGTSPRGVAPSSDGETPLTRQTSELAI